MQKELKEIFYKRRKELNLCLNNFFVANAIEMEKLNGKPLAIFVKEIRDDKKLDEATKKMF